MWRNFWVNESMWAHWSFNQSGLIFLTKLQNFPSSIFLTQVCYMWQEYFLYRDMARQNMFNIFLQYFYAKGKVQVCRAPKRKLYNTHPTCGLFDFVTHIMKVHTVCLQLTKIKQVSFQRRYHNDDNDVERRWGKNKTFIIVTLLKTKTFSFLPAKIILMNISCLRIALFLRTRRHSFNQIWI